MVFIFIRPSNRGVLGLYVFLYFPDIVLTNFTNFSIIFLVIGFYFFFYDTFPKCRSWQKGSFTKNLTNNFDTFSDSTVTFVTSTVKYGIGGEKKDGHGLVRFTIRVPKPLSTRNKKHEGSRSCHGPCIIQESLT